mmetsp:Transcript_18091/g.41682  ORF Transcript_18091/g.41682 Transcript_18091/m.41682 type:complete len:118 (-) Transcript_18091:1761-2114(-)
MRRSRASFHLGVVSEGFGAEILAFVPDDVVRAIDLRRSLDLVRQQPKVGFRIESVLGAVEMERSDAVHVQIAIPPQGVGEKTGLVPRPKDAPERISEQVRLPVPPDRDELFQLVQDL